MSVERPFTPAPSSKPADWIVERLTDFAVNVLSVVPSGFEAYARVFHPAEKVTYTSPDWAEWQIEPVRWTEVAELTGRTAHQTMQWASLNNENSFIDDESALKVGDVWVRGPEVGNLPIEVAQALWPLLEPHTKTSAMCFFAIWEGFGGLPNFIREAPAFEIPDRRFYLFRAPLQTIEQSFYTGATYDDMGGGFMVMLNEEETAGVLQQEPEPVQSRGVDVLISTGPEQPTPEEIKEALKNLPPFDLPPFNQSANLWWPKDRAWCVHTEIDFNTTYVAGSQGLIDAVLASEKLEAYQLEPTDELVNDAVNPIPDDPYGSSFKIG